MQPPITEISQEDLARWLEGKGAEGWRAVPILRWIHRRGASGFAAMTDQPKGLRGDLARSFRFFQTRCAGERESSDQTEKLLLEVEGGDVIETVLIRDRVRTKTGEIRERRTVCVSSQVGCPMACVFCASGMNGWKRNLTTAEIVEQVLHVQRLLPQGERISNVVIMGIGEPLLNYGNIVRALRIWKAPWGAGIGFNRVTLSTVGVLGRLDHLIRDGVTPNLALSLHAPNDEIRHRVVPTMPKMSVAEILRAGAGYKRQTRKNVTFEYVLLAGVNDEPAHARELGQKVRGTGCKVNVIPFNPVEELPYREPSVERIDAFVKELGACGVPVTVRKRKGSDVAAACGQLRARWTKSSQTRSASAETRT